ncbi:MAG: nucleotide sugar dehydrogenase [Pseudomonadota bacterium]
MNVHLKSPLLATDIASGGELAFTKPAVSIIGLGYVGVVSAACLSDLGHDVIGVDIDEDKIGKLSAGVSPIVEPGLDNLLEKGAGAGRIKATTNLNAAILGSDVTFVSVNTPTAEDGSCDMTAIRAVAAGIGDALRNKGEYHVIVLRCSVPPGTTRKVFLPLVEEHSGKSVGIDFGICFNPEFLRESTAIDDFRNPPKTVIGATDARASAALAGILDPVDAMPISTTLDAAEMVKYADNVWHAAKVCFGNEIGRICQHLEIDGHEVMEIFCQDTVLNISPHYLKPGFAYGGSCLPKEVRAVNHLAERCGLQLPMIESLPRTNDCQVEQAVRLIAATGKKRIGLCGLTFKPDTDDLRESPSLRLAGRLLELGFEVSISDPNYPDAASVMRQVAMLRHHYHEDALTLRKLSDRVTAHVSELLARSEVIVTTQPSRYWLAALAANLEAHDVVDLTRLFKEQPKAKSYQGIGW